MAAAKKLSYLAGVEETVADLKRTDPDVLPLLAAHVAAARKTGTALDGSASGQVTVLREHRLIINEIVKVAEERRKAREVVERNVEASFVNEFERLVAEEKTKT